MISNHWVIKAINNLLDNRRIRTLLIVVSYLILLFIIGLLTQYLELDFSLLQRAHEYLKPREMKDGLIRYAYITLSIGVLSIGSIMFTLLIGKIQSLVNEVNYSSFHRKTYIDGKILNKYMLLMSISIVLLINYLIADTSAYPLTYLIILLIIFLTVVYILNSLFTSLFNDLNLFRILDKNYKTINGMFDEFKKSHTRLKKMENINEKLKAKLIGNLKLMNFDKRIELMKINLEDLSNLHYSECRQSVEELKYIVVTACRRKDSELLRATLDYTNIHIKHHLEILNYTIDESINFWSNCALGKSYKFVIHNCLPIYEIPELHKAELNLTEIAHDSFTSIMYDPEVFKPGGKEIDDIDFRLLLDKYCNMTIKCIESGLNSEIYGFSFSIENMIEDIRFDSIEKFRQISSNNIALISELIATSNTRDLSLIFDIQSKILRKVITNERFESVSYFALSDFFKLFEMYINSLDDSKSFDIMWTVSSCLDNDEYDSISQILADVITNLDSRLDGIESLGFELNLTSVILKLLEKKQMSISKAIRLDESVFFGFASIMNIVMDILRKYIGLKKTTYHIHLMEKSLMQYCDYLLVYNGFDNWHAFIEMEKTFKKLFHDSHVKESAINAYVYLIKKIVINDIEISKSVGETDTPFQSTINIEGIITQMYYFEEKLFEHVLNQIDLLLSTEELDFLIEHVIGLIVELNTELSNELFGNVALSNINKSEFKRELSSLIGLYMEASQAYNDNEG